MRERRPTASRAGCWTSPSTEGLERIFHKRGTAHRFGNERKVGGWNLELTKPERCTPVRFALDKREPLNQRLDRRRAAARKPYIDSVWLEVRKHFNLIDLTGDDCANGRE